MFTRYPHLYLILAFLLAGGLFHALIAPLIQAKESNFNCTDVTEIPQVECEALVAFYMATDGDNWDNNDDWLETNTPCQWPGISCNGGQVSQLGFNANGLSGELLPELGNLANLWWLYLPNNQLSGEIPAELGNLANLQMLNLRNNQLSGAIPAELGNLANLQVLSLGSTSGSNQLSGEIPPELGGLANLEELDLGINQLSGEIPPELGNLTNLEVLRLHINQLSGEIPSELGNLANLEVLSLTINQLSGEIPPELSNLTNLQSLHLPSNQLSGEIPPELGDLTNLEGLVLGRNQLSGEIPPELGNLANLEILSLSGNQLSGEIPSELSSLTNLRVLLLLSNQLSGAIPPELGNLVSLVSLEMSANQLNEIPPELGNLANLEVLTMSSNQLSGVPEELGNLTNLQYLHLHQNLLSGELPNFLTNLTLTNFTFYDTEWCVPEEGAVLDWLETIPDLYSSGLICDMPGSSLEGLVTTIEAEVAANIQVDLYRSIEFDNWQHLTTTHTSEVGSYQFDDLGQGIGIDYRVRFVDPQDQYATQYYDNAPNIDLATAITITPGIPRTGIDAVLNYDYPLYLPVIVQQ